MPQSDTKSTHPMESLVGPKLLVKAKGQTISTAYAFKEKDLVALYFSASWCPPCKSFSPVLIDFYNKCKEKAKLEIVYVSSDRNLPDFHEYYGKMPWLAIPEDKGAAQIKKKLSELLRIQGIPTLVIMDAKTGKFISATARNDVASFGGDEAKAMKVIENWKAIEAVPVDQAVIAPQGPTGIMAIILHVLKNPIYIFGLIYLYRQAMKKLFPAEDLVEEDEPIPQTGTSEF